MVKVTVRVESNDKENGYSTKAEVREHKQGQFAQVYNGVLTIFDAKPEKTEDLKFGIAGYYSGTWLDWEKI